MYTLSKMQGRRMIKRGGAWYDAINPVNIVKDKIKDIELAVTNPGEFIKHPSKYIGLLPGVGMVSGTIASQGLKQMGLGKRKKKGGRKKKVGGKKKK